MANHPAQRENQGYKLSRFEKGPDQTSSAEIFNIIMRIIHLSIPDKGDFFSVREQEFSPMPLRGDPIYHPAFGHLLFKEGELLFYNWRFRCFNKYRSF